MKLLSENIIKSTVFVHYGNSDFDLSKVNPVRAYKNHYCKPKSGGLWFSSSDAIYGWINFCKNQGYPGFRGKYKWEARLNPGLKIAEVNDPEDILDFPLGRISYVPDFYCEFLDYGELIEQGYDGIYLSDQAVLGFRNLRNNCFRATFNYWDCETLFLFSPDSIKQLVSYETNTKMARVENIWEGL